MKLVSSKLAFSLSVGLTTAFKQETIAISYKLQNAAPEFASIMFDLFPEFQEELFNHGCWCAKLASLEPIGLGGNKPVDELDQICKDWARARRCTKQDGASCEFQDNSGTYAVAYDSDDPSGIYRRYYCPDVDSCLSETCQIDSFYLKQIISWRSINGSNFVAVKPDSCPMGNGRASPMQQMKKMLKKLCLTTPAVMTTPTTAATTQFEPDCIEVGGTPGQGLVCPENYALIGICGSGITSDCGPNIFHKIKCCKANTQAYDEIRDVNAGQNRETCYWVGTEEFKGAACPAHLPIAAGICQSANHIPICLAKSMPFSVTFAPEWPLTDQQFGQPEQATQHATFCCSVGKNEHGNDNLVEDDQIQWVYGKFGENIDCPAGYVVKTTCGSGEAPTCQNTGPGVIGESNFGTAIECAKWAPINHDD